MIEKSIDGKLNICPQTKLMINEPDNAYQFTWIHSVIWNIVVKLVQFTLKSSPCFYSVRVLQFKGILCNQSEQFHKNNYYCNHFQQVRSRKLVWRFWSSLIIITYTCTTRNHPHYNKILSGKIKKSKIT